MGNHWFKKICLSQWFLEVKYSNIGKFVDVNPEDTCYVQGTQKTMMDSTLIKIGEGMFGEVMVPNIYQRSGESRFRGRGYCYF